MNILKPLLIIVAFSLSSIVYSLPMAPDEELHPGSTKYSYGVSYEKFEVANRKIDLYLPVGLEEGEKAPVIVYGHGQALNHTHYEEAFFHLAKKGIAVIFPQYDSGFFDQDWERMAKDFNSLTAKVLNLYKGQLDRSKVVYSGHSKGAFVGLMAAGAPNFNNMAKSLVFFAPARVNEDYLQRLNKETPLSVIWGEDDNIIKKDLVTEIYEKASVSYKQFIEVNNYEQLDADHFYMLTKRTLFGGHRGLSAYHYHGVFKWLIGAVRDLEQGRITDTFLYGDRALESGDNGVRHTAIRSW